MAKIDAEGSDLKVLRGASSLLGKTDVLIAEAEVCGNYENSVAEVIQFMANAGYAVDAKAGISVLPGNLHSPDSLRCGRLGALQNRCA
jgi:hypothetical protein